jgi:S-(hydroxymethyl)glutathione dehydrogenase/alcohol dehydrogenase
MPRNVRAAVFYGPGKPIQIETLQLDDPQADEVLIKVLATGLCHSDLHMIEGKQEQAVPAVLGHESTGVIVQCGADVKGLAPGDHVIPFFVPECGQCPNCLSGKTNICLKMPERVSTDFTRLSKDGEPVHTFCGLGTFADHMVVKADRVAKINAHAKADAACYASCGGATGFGSVRYAGVDRNSSAVVFGLGGIGLNVVQGCKRAGAKVIIGIDTNPAKEAVAREYGVTHFINPKNCENVIAEVFKVLPLGADYAFECVGVPALMRQAVEASNPFYGRTVIVGVAPQGAELSVTTSSVATGRLVGGLLMGGMRAKTDIPQLIEDYVRGDIDLDGLISHRLKLEQINEGFELMKRGESTRAVILFD